MRLFLAVDLDPDARGALRRHLDAAAPDGLPGRVVPPENWHVTLRFLGQADPTRHGAVERAMAARDLGGEFQVRLGALGAFNRPARGAVLWVAAEDPERRMARLAAIAEQAARDARFAPEEKPFTPHVTLARLRPPRNVAPLVQRAAPAGIILPVRSVVLFRSHTGAGPPRYEPVAQWPLAPG